VLLLILVGQIAIVTWGGEVFRTVPITLRDWAIIVPREAVPGNKCPYSYLIVR